MTKLYGMKRIYRERFDKKLGGVCGGLAQYFQVDSSIIRMIWLGLTLPSVGIPLIIYLICWAILPLGPKAYVVANYKRLYRSRRDRHVSGILGGFGKYFKIDSNILRLIFVILTFITTGYMILLYIAGIYVIPEEPSK